MTRDAGIIYTLRLWFEGKLEDSLETRNLDAVMRQFNLIVCDRLRRMRRGRQAFVSVVAGPASGTWSQRSMTVASYQVPRGRPEKRSAVAKSDAARAVRAVRSLVVLTVLLVPTATIGHPVALLTLSG